MDRNDTFQALLDALVALDELEAGRKEFMNAHRSERERLLQDMTRYRKRLSGEDRQLELEAEK